MRAQVLDHGSQSRQEPLAQLPEDVLAAPGTGGGAGADDDAGAAEREGFGRWTAAGR